MKLEAQKVVSVPALGPVKMDDRKRPVPDHDDSPRPTKRQNTVVNGAKSESNTGTGDIFNSSDIEAYQKDAILRQMKEYRREKERLESQLGEIERSSEHYHDHLRIIDAWFGQFIDEIRVLVNDLDSIGSKNNDATVFPDSLSFNDNERFQEHLASKSQKIKDALSSLFSKLPPSAPETGELQRKLSSLLAQEKEYIVDLQRATSERDQLQERLEKASYRYMIAEKKLDRVQSAVVAKMERGAAQIAKPTSGESTKDKSKDDVNGVVLSADNENKEAELKAALAVSAKRQEQLEQLETENKKLTSEVTTLNSKITGLSDEDYAKSDLFKALKTQYEDVVKRINHLEATNTQLREEALKLHKERTAYRMEIDEEQRQAIADTSQQMSKLETDLVRIRGARDEMVSEIAVLKAAQNNHDIAADQVNELANSRQERITALEKEVERLRIRVGEVKPLEQAELDSMGHEELVAEVKSLKSQVALLSPELQSMESAYKKAQALASKKVTEIAQWEEQAARLNAEKAKADQKYFAAMKSKESREVENRALRSQNAKSSEIITQLKEAETTRLTQKVNAEHQLSAVRESNENLTNQQMLLQQKLNQLTISNDGQLSTITEQRKFLMTKDEQLAAQAKAKRELELEFEKVRAHFAELEKRNEELKKKAAGHQTDQDVMLRRIVYCNDHKTNVKNTVLKTCGHVLCDLCVKTLLEHRNRKCPHCKKTFGYSDHMKIHLDT